MLASKQIPNNLLVIDGIVINGNDNYCGPVTIGECCVLYYAYLSIRCKANWGGDKSPGVAHNQTVDAYCYVTDILAAAMVAGKVTQNLYAEFNNWYYHHEI